MGKMQSITTRVWYNEKILFLKDYSGNQREDTDGFNKNIVKPHPL